MKNDGWTKLYGFLCTHKKFHSEKRFDWIKRLEWENKNPVESTELWFINIYLFISLTQTNFSEIKQTFFWIYIKLDELHVFLRLIGSRFLVKSTGIFVRYKQILFGWTKCFSDCKVGCLKFVKNGQ